MDGFQLHSRLAADCHVITRLAACHLLLQRNSLLPWYILVPEVDMLELHLLPHPLRTRIRDETDTIAGFIKLHHGCMHTNVALIGNVVPQLHVHVIGRSPGDICWPGVAWGNLPDGPAWTDAELASIRGALVDHRIVKAG